MNLQEQIHMMFDEGFHMKNVKSLTKKQTTTKETKQNKTKHKQKKQKNLTQCTKVVVPSPLHLVYIISRLQSPNTI